jgi:hypothetical protein
MTIKLWNIYTRSANNDFSANEIYLQQYSSRGHSYARDLINVSVCVLHKGRKGVQHREKERKQFAVVLCERRSACTKWFNEHHEEALYILHQMIHSEFIYKTHLSNNLTI